MKEKIMNINNIKCKESSRGVYSCGINNDEYNIIINNPLRWSYSGRGIWTGGNIPDIEIERWNVLELESTYGKIGILHKNKTDHNLGKLFILRGVRIK
jgi:hypothetical protein